MGFTFLFGGVRSGKSRLAVELAEASGKPVAFLATAEPGDEEMAERIRRHVAKRPPDWVTIEAPLDLSAAILQIPEGTFVVLDCLTLWVSNLLVADRDLQVEGLAARVAAQLATLSAGVVVVSNEVGMGIVPANPLARSYRDLMGTVNASFAAAADTVVFVAAGRPLVLGEPADLVLR